MRPCGPSERGKPARIVVAGSGRIAIGMRTSRDPLRRRGLPVYAEPFYAVAFYYDDFAQVSDEDVRRILSRAERSDHKWQVA